MQKASIKQAFWDYNFTERQLLRKLENGTRKEKIWIIGRILENLPFNSIWKYITLTQMKDFFPFTKLQEEVLKNFFCPAGKQTFAGSKTQWLI